MPSAAGKKILIVEDEYLIASELDQSFKSFGVDVLGPASSIEKAGEYVDDADAAVLDVGINGELVFPIADRLMERRKPFVFYTGYNAAVLPDRFRHVAVVSKPTQPDALLMRLFPPPGEAVGSLSDIGAGHRQSGFAEAGPDAK